MCGSVVGTRAVLLGHLMWCWGYIYAYVFELYILLYIVASLHDSLDEWSSWTLNEAVFGWQGFCHRMLYEHFLPPTFPSTLNWVWLHLCIRPGLRWPAWVPHPSSDRARLGLKELGEKEIVSTLLHPHNNQNAAVVAQHT